MKRLRVGVNRYASVSDAIARAIGVTPAPDCRIGHGRITVTFGSIDATRWQEPRQVEFALQVAAVARQLMSGDSRRAVSRRADDRAIVVVFEDATLLRGCSVVARWECVVPARGPTPA